ncbi:MAG: sulfotransferase, partial [Alphaproteobacteria bacterium]|nr:sulfotransferase [Alphaproteobacteria bacterium]
MSRQTDQARRAVALHKGGDPAGAEKIYRRILKQDPTNGQVRYLLGVARLEQGKFESGRKVLEQALRADPENADILFSLGRALQETGDRDAALRHLQTARERAPQRAVIWSAIGDTLSQQDQPHAAIEAYAQALELQPNDWRVFVNAAIVHVGVGDVEEGAAMLHRAADVRRHPKILLNLALAEQELGNFAVAAELFDEVLAVDPDNIDARASRAVHLQTIGEKDQAWDLLQSLDGQSFQSSLPVLAYAKIAPAHDDDAQQLTEQACRYIETLLANPTIATHDRTQLNFALGHLRDRLGRFDAAFDVITAGAVLSPATYDRGAVTQRFKKLREFFTGTRFAELARSTVRSKRPLFIVGVPRSGTSLVEQILDSHPDVAGAGELVEIQSIERELGIGETPQRLADMRSEDLDPYAQRYLRLLDHVDADAARVSDKLPGNFERLGLIALLFPDARIIHCTRDPLDTCLSCYFQDFRYRNAYSYSLENLGHYYGHYAALMGHWRNVLPLPMLDIGYETLVARPKETIAEMLDFCGLGWDDGCLAFHDNP